MPQSLINQKPIPYSQSKGQSNLKSEYSEEAFGKNSTHTAALIILLPSPEETFFVFFVVFFFNKIKVLKKITTFLT